ncbi:MAG: MauE/DoxX family redox-associated membrane protein [Pseudomonadota bacterium]
MQTNNLNKKNILKAIFILTRIMFGGTFIWASLDKFLHPQVFADIILNYKILPAQLVNLPAIILPLLELLCGVLLLCGIYFRGSALILNTLLIIFIGAIGSVLARGIDIRCGCFTLSQSADSVALSDLTIDGLLLLAGILVLFYRGEKP